MPWRCQPGSSSCREGSKPSGATYGLKSSDTKTRTKVGVVHPSTDLHVTFAVHPIASNGLGGVKKKNWTFASPLGIRRAEFSHNFLSKILVRC